MIESKLISNGKEPKVRPFPKLMANQMVIAMFASEKQATVVYEKTDSSVSVGTVMGISDFRNFIEFDGVVELSNI